MALVIELAALLPAALATPSKVINLPGPIEAIACTTGALSGALHASRKHLDLMGVMVVAICTGVGGGAIRDVLLDSGLPTFLVSPSLLLYALLAAAIGTVFATLVQHFQPMMVVIDALLIGVWVVIGVQKSLLDGLSPVTALFVGVVACVGGGVLRDVLCRDQPEVFRPGTLYAVAAVAGASAYLALASANAPEWVCVSGTVVVAAGLRGASSWLGWRTTAAGSLMPVTTLPEPPT